MTEMPLAEAIAVLHGPDLDTTWIASDFKRGLLPDVVCEALAEVVTAVASGDLIPRTDAELAVALAYQRAAETCYSKEDHDAILALAPAEPLAEVERMRRQIEAVCRAHMVGAERCVALEDEVDRLRTALEWYDDGSSMGTRARAALAPQKDATP